MTIQNIICDIDGVLMHDNVAVPGAAEFIKRILDKGMPLVMLTNYPSQTGGIWRTVSPPPGLRCRIAPLHLGDGDGRFSAPPEGKKAYVVGEGR